MISQALERTLSKLIKISRNQKIPFLLMGGIATSVYAMPRATFDIDAVIAISREKFAQFLAQVEKDGFVYDQKKPLKTIGNFSFLTLYSKKDKIYVDIFLAEGAFQNGMVQRAKEFKLGIKTVRIISPEDLVLLKLSHRNFKNEIPIPCCFLTKTNAGDKIGTDSDVTPVLALRSKATGPGGKIVPCEARPILQTGRERDLEDVRNIISENAGSLDFKYLKKWAKELGLEVFLNDELRGLGVQKKLKYP